MDENEFRELLNHTQPRPIAVRGRVVAASLHGTFSLVFDDGSEVAVSANEHFPIKRLAQFLGEDVSVDGVGLFDRSARLVFFIAHGFAPSNPTSAMARKLPIQSIEQRETQSRRLKAIIGKWPGSESEADAEDQILTKRN